MALNQHKVIIWHWGRQVAHISLNYTLTLIILIPGKGRFMVSWIRFSGFLNFKISCRRPWNSAYKSHSLSPSGKHWVFMVCKGKENIDTHHVPKKLWSLLSLYKGLNHSSVDTSIFPKARLPSLISQNWQYICYVILTVPDYMGLIPWPIWAGSTFLQ